MFHATYTEIELSRCCFHVEKFLPIKDARVFGEGLFASCSVNQIILALSNVSNKPFLHQRDVYREIKNVKDV